MCIEVYLHVLSGYVECRVYLHVLSGYVECRVYLHVLSGYVECGARECQTAFSRYPKFTFTNLRVDFMWRVRFLI